MDNWIFKRPPYSLGKMERPTERFDFRVVIRYDASLAKNPRKLEDICDAIYKARRSLNEKLKGLFGNGFLLDDSSPVLCGPRRSPQGIDEFFIVVGSDYFKPKESK